MSSFTVVIAFISVVLLYIFPFNGA